jgi:hypothetical protein
MAKNIQIEPSEEYTEAQSFFTKHIVPIVAGIFVVIAAIVIGLIAIFYPQNYDGSIVEPDTNTQQ